MFICRTVNYLGWCYSKVQVFFGFSYWRRETFKTLSYPGFIGIFDRLLQNHVIVIDLKFKLLNSLGHVLHFCQHLRIQDFFLLLANGTIRRHCPIQNRISLCWAQFLLVDLATAASEVVASLFNFIHYFISILRSFLLSLWRRPLHRLILRYFWRTALCFLRCWHWITLLWASFTENGFQPWAE